MRLPTTSSMRALPLLLLLAAQPAAAQPAVDWGVRLGGTASAYSFSLDEPDFEFDSEREIGFEAALTATHSLNSLLSLVAEVGYAHRRFSLEVEEQTRLTPDSSPNTVSLVSTYDIGSLSVLGKVSPLGERTLSPYLVLGPRVDALLSADDQSATIRFLRPSGMVEEREVSNRFSDLLVDFSLSGVAGLGISFELPNRSTLHFEGRYDRTLTDPLSGDVDASRKLDSFGLSLGVTI
jgi:hypothetical protein